MLNRQFCRPSEVLRKKCSKHSKNLGVYFGYMGAKPPGCIEPKIFLEEGIRDLITCLKFGDNAFRCLASAEGQILPIPIDFNGRPYDTLTLPCERVILCWWGRKTLHNPIQSNLDRSGSRDVIGHVTNLFPGGHFL